jgi:predicted dehydrogenase
MPHSATSRRVFLGSATALAAGRVHGANDRIQIGLVGGGGRGSNHINDLIKLKDLNAPITGLCDVWAVNRNRAAAAIEKGFGARPRLTSDYRELLSWKDIDAIVIAVPDFAHPMVLKAAIEAGKDAYVEKPFGTTFPEVKAAYLAVKNSRQIVQVGTQRRSDGKFQAAQKLVASGAIGKVTRVEFCMHFQQPRWKRPDEKVDPASVDWTNFQMGKISRPFDQRLLREWQLFDGETTNGIPGLWMSHFIDLIPWYLDDPYPASAVSAGGVYLWKDGRRTADVFSSLLEYQDCLVTFAMSLTNSAGIRCIFHGTRGTVDCEKWTLSGEGSVMKDKVPAESKIVAEVTDTHMHNWLECLRSRRQPRADVQAGFSHAVAGIMCSQAHEKGRRMTFDRQKLEIV